MVMKSKVIERIRKRTSPETRERVKKMMEEPFSPFAQILPEEWWDWNESDWSELDFISYASNEAWNRDESSERGYMAMKRMLYFLVDPQKECKTNTEFAERLKEFYEHRKNS